ncbi:MAG: hypothetical protein IJ200_04635 [Prevotella sp.]|nr:hypothetical protein [Prevotella sp.]
MKPRESHHSAFVRGLHLLPFYLFTLLFFLSACTSIDCPVQNNVYTVYKLKKADNTPDTLIKDTLWIWTPRANGTGASGDLVMDENDTLLINRLCGTSASGFNLPISYTLPEDTICLLLRNFDRKDYVDTIFIKKDNMPHFESVDCQASYFHHISSVRWTSRVLESVVINNPNVNYDTSTEHIFLYFKADR